MATPMRLFYWKTQPNFGDQLNPYIWPKLFPDFFDAHAPTLFFGIGSILRPRLSGQHNDKHVFGAGWGGDRLPVINATWHFHFVRGPLTARHLALDPALALTDPAILVHGFEQSCKSYAVSYMPHWSYDTPALRAVCRQQGVHYISPLNTDVESIISQIAASELILAEAMHGAIVADALRVPWLPIEVHLINRFKWRDWCSSMEMEFRPSGYLQRDWQFTLKKVIRRIPRLDTWAFGFFLDRLLHREIKPFLSEDRIFERRLGQVQEQVERFRKRFAE